MGEVILMMAFGFGIGSEQELEALLTTNTPIIQSVAPRTQVADLNNQQINEIYPTPLGWDADAWAEAVRMINPSSAGRRF